MLWVVLAVAFLFGLLWVPASIVKDGIATSENGAIDLRWTLLTLAAVTAALSAVVALPFTLLRTKYTREQTDYTRKQTATEEEGLLTDRINKAVEGLGAQKEVNRLGRTIAFTVDGVSQSEFQWKEDPDPVPDGATGRVGREWRNIALTEPNLEVRIGAIYALERLAIRNLEAHVQIMKILCAYIRENAPAKTDDGEPQDWLKESEDDGPLEDDWEQRADIFRAELTNWLKDAKPRPDIRAAMEVIGSRNREQRLAEACYGNAAPETAIVFDEAPEDASTEAQDERDATDLLRRLYAWRERARKFAGYRLDLRDVDLRGADLTKLNLAGANLHRARLHGAVLREARLQGAILQEARLQGAILREARLQGAQLSEAQLQGAVLWNAQLQGSVLREARLQKSALWKARMQGTQLWKTQLQGAVLWNARLQGANPTEARLQGADLSEARLDKVVLFATRLQGALLWQTRLQGAVLSRTRLQGAFLWKARLHGARLEGADLEGIRVDSDTILTADSNHASAVRSTDYTQCTVERRFFEEAFGDASVKGLPEGYVAGEPPLDHWASVELDDNAFKTAWRAWQVEIGYRKPRAAD
jgi:uncharacterized protein YjbI with pentapeptide repeats